MHYSPVAHMTQNTMVVYIKLERCNAISCDPTVARNHELHMTEKQWSSHRAMRPSLSPFMLGRSLRTFLTLLLWRHHCDVWLKQSFVVTQGYHIGCLWGPKSVYVLVCYNGLVTLRCQGNHQMIASDWLIRLTMVKPRCQSAQTQRLQLQPVAKY